MAKGQERVHSLLAVMAAPTRFERATFPLGGGRSIQLSYEARQGEIFA